MLYEVFGTLDSCSFVTDQSVTYTVYFLPGENYLPNQSYSPNLFVFGFNATPSSKGSFDRKVGATIIKILYNFFDDNHNLIVYSCDQTDSRESVRKRLFDNWFNAYGLFDFIKVDFQFDETLFVSVIYRKDNPKIRDIELTLSDFGKTLYDK